MKFASLMYFGTVAVSVLSVLWMAGCANLRERQPAHLSPRSLEDVQKSAPVSATPANQPRVALVLGGGGLRGFAHLGVLRALEDAGIQPDIVVGTSAGAVIGAAYASGLSPEQIESIARGIKLSSLIDFTLSKSGLMRGDNIARWIDAITAGVPIENFPRRFAAVATELRSGKAVLLDAGSPGTAVQASAAVPGVNVPLAYKDGHLVDGGIASLVPVRFARAMGADVIVAVDIYCTGPGGEGLAAPSVLLRVMRVQSCLVAAAEMAEADVLISPSVSVSGMSAKGEQERAIAAGYDATRASLGQIQSHISHFTQGFELKKQAAAAHAKATLQSAW
jgi:NTE family protein